MAFKTTPDKVIFLFLLIFGVTYRLGKYVAHLQQSHNNHYYGDLSLLATEEELREQEKLLHSHNHTDHNVKSNTITFAILVAIRSKESWGDLHTIPFFSILLNSMLPTLTFGGYKYKFYLGYDDNDAYFTNSNNRDAFRAHFQKRVGIKPVYLKFTQTNNTRHAPCWVWNALADIAYHDGANYFYQLNDDIKFLSQEQWAPSFVETFRNKTLAPDFGVVAPECVDNSAIFTQSCVSRVHIEIFDYYYPPDFKNWWSDDWISAIYRAMPQSAHFLRQFKVQNTNSHGTRYEVDYAAAPTLGKNIDEAKRKLLTWLRSHGKNVVPLN